MVNISKIGDSAVKFVFTDSDHYLYGNGEIEVPVNSLLLVIDESDMVTFKKLSGDPFLSFRADNSNLGTKAAIEQFYKDNMVGSTGGSESGITSGDVQTMIDNSLEDYYTDDEVDAALSGKASVSDVTAVASDVSTLSGQVATKVSISDFNAYSAATDARIAEDEEVTAAALNNLNENKQDALQYYSENTEDKTATIHIEDTENGTQSEVVVDGASVDVYAQSNFEEEGSAIETHTDIWGHSEGIAMTYEKNIDDAEAAHCYFNVNEGLISMEVMANEETTNVDVTSTVVTINGENVATESYVDDVISGKVDTSAITTAITSGSTDSEIPTAKAVYDATQSGGGGATYSAGTNISIANDTINCTLPISVTGRYLGKSLILTNGNVMAAEGACSIIAGNFVNANENASYGCAVGSWLNIKNISEAAFGTHNNSVTDSTASGQTLFSVGNGTSSARHNAFEIRQNGDIYVNDGTNDVRLQDTILALGGLKFVQCSQSDYDSMVSGGTIDSSTIYFISNVVS